MEEISGGRAAGGDTVAACGRAVKGGLIEKVVELRSEWWKRRSSWEQIWSNDIPSRRDIKCNVSEAGNKRAMPRGTERRPEGVKCGTKWRKDKMGKEGGLVQV